MEERIRQLNAEYGFELTDEEIRSIVLQTAAYERLFRQLYEIDLSGVVPLQTLDLRSRR